jgi:hypothetical protein
MGLRDWQIQSDLIRHQFMKRQDAAQQLADVR